MMMNALQAAPAALPAAPQGKNRPTIKGKATPSKMEGKATPAMRRDIPEVQPSSGAIPKWKWKEAQAAPLGKTKATATSKSASKSSWSIKKEEKRSLCFPPINLFNASAVYIDGDAAAIQ